MDVCLYARERRGNFETEIEIEIETEIEMEFEFEIEIETEIEIEIDVKLGGFHTEFSQFNISVAARSTGSVSGNSM